MARRGRLSRGCQICRKRKIKCDQFLPGCSQCRKSGWVCPGYADAVERMFQYQHVDSIPLAIGKPVKAKSRGDERTKVIKRRAARVPVSASDGAMAMAMAMAKTAAPTSRLEIRNLPSEIAHSLNDRAIDYFLSTHALRDTGEIRGCYEYLFTLPITTWPETSSCLTAAALAAYGNACHSAEIVKEARTHYGRSLRLVNAALADRARASETSTMVSILLLNSFEALMSDGLESMGYSDGHMKGVMMIMALRGPGLMESREGVQVFLHMCRCLITYCIMRPVEVPGEVVTLRTAAARYLDTGNPAWVMEELMIKLAKFRAEVEVGGIVESHDIIDIASRLDDELSQLTSGLHGHGPSGTIATQEADPPLPGDYPDTWFTYICNYTRTCRLILHRMIQEELERDDRSRSNRKRHNLDSQSQLKSQALTQDICASILQYCDNMRPRASPSGNKGTVPRIAGAYFLLWPVLTAGHLTESTELRDWIIDQCHSVGQVTGIRRANAIAGVLKRGENIFHARQQITNTSRLADGAGLPNRRWLEHCD
ncbi:hypothetical protein BJY00DRAFT_298949 [Aspergillus carlsbadensis]|nr:hypothetical protein BJY00DRAFT_298949 [Aspergillus carlsbadensis]